MPAVKSREACPRPIRSSVRTSPRGSSTAPPASTSSRPGSSPGAEGETAPEGSVVADGEADPESLSDAEFAELEDEVEEVEEAIESGDQDAISEAEEDVDEAVVARRAKRAKPSPDAPTKKGGFRFVAFLRASWSELQRVQWPDRRQVGQATAVVLGFVVVAGLYLGVADAAAKWLVDRII